MKVILNTQDIQIINIFQSITGSDIIDCISDDDEIYLVVAEGQYGLAVGKRGAKIKNAEKILRKSIKVFEYSKDLEKFIQNLIPEAREIVVKDNVAHVKVANSDKVRVIGKRGKNIKMIKKFLKRLFEIEDVKLK